MKLKILKNGFEKNLEMPAKSGDVGYDMRAASMRIVGEECFFPKLWRNIEYLEYDTGIAIEPFFYKDSDEFYENPYSEKISDYSKYVQVKPRSSLCNYNLVLANHVATIDPNFRSTIKCRFKYIFSPCDLKIVEGEIVGKINENRIYKVGDKIAQAVFSEVIHPEIIYVDKLSDSERRGGEFGSTGK